MAYIGNDVRSNEDYKIIDDISSGFNGSTTSFALQVGGATPVPFPKFEQQLLISVNGVIQEPDPTGSAGFKLLGTNIVFSSAPTNGHAFFGVIYAGADYVNAGGTFPDGSINFPSITFSEDTNTGFTRTASGTISVISDGTKVAQFPTSQGSNGQVLVTDGGGTLSYSSTITSPIVSGDLTIPDKIVHTGDTNTAIRFPAADTFSVETAGTEKLRVDSGGHISIGTATSRAIGGSVERKLQVEATSADAGVAITRNSANAVGPFLSFGKSRSSSVGGTTVVQSGDQLGQINFSGADGSDIVSNAASIRALVDGTPGSNDMPGRLEFSTTADGAASPTARMTIKADGNVGIGTAIPSVPSGTALEISGSSVSRLKLSNSTTGTGSTDGFQIYTSGNTAILENKENAEMRFYTNASERLRLDSSGNVGIGVSSPATILHISQTNPELRIQGTNGNGGVHKIFSAGVNSESLQLTGASNLLFNADTQFFRSSDEGTEYMRIDSSGRLLLGTSTARAVGGESAPVLHIEGAGNTSNSWVNLTRFQAGNASANFQFAKARSNTPGTYTLVQSGDNLGAISFLGADGTDMANYAAQIAAQVDGTAASNDMPGRLVFSTTASGAGTVTERMRIDSSGNVIVKTNDVALSGSGTLRINSGSTAGALNLDGGASNHGGEINLLGGSNGGRILFRSGVGAGQQGEKMRLNENGNLGIGTTSPSSILTLNHATNPAIRFEDSGTKVVQINAEGSSTNFGSFEGKALVFATSTGSAFSERMRIDTAGNVGIGTSGPKAGLHVATENTTYGKNAVFGANGWVNNANYHYTDATISLLGQDADGNNKGAGIEFSTRNTADTNWRHGAINQERDSDLVFILGGSGTFQGVERLRIKGNGLMAFNSNGTVNATYQFDYAPATGGLIVNANAAFTGNSVALQFRTAPSTTSGNITLTNNGTTTAYGTSSDYRLKENAVAISDGITRLKTLKPYRFNFKTTPDTTVDGFFAHEVTAVPEAIVGDKDEVDSDNNPVYQSMDYAKITPLLTAALQEAITKIETLETKVAALEAA